MKKRLFAAAMTLCMMTLMLSACGGGSGSDGKDAADAGEKTYTIKFGHVESEDRSIHRAALEFKKYIEEESDGHLLVEVYPNATLGGDVQLTESVSQGTIQMATPTTSTMTMYDSKWDILDMPFIFDSAESCFAALDGELGQQLADTLTAQNIKVMGYDYNGARSMTNSKHPINVPEDLAGMKVRVMESPVFIDLFQTLGANATPMAYSELFTGLQQGTVDAQENGPSVVYVTKFQEVQDYFSLTEHVHSPFVIITNMDFYNSLPQEYQELLTEATQKWMIDWQRAEEIADNEKYLDLLEEEGMQINTVSPENIQKFKDKLAPMYEKYEEKLGKEIFDLARSYNN